MQCLAWAFLNAIKYPVMDETFSAHSRENFSEPSEADYNIAASHGQ